MTLSKIFNLEKRTLDNLHKVYLYKVKDKWRAYDFSAFIICKILAYTKPNTNILVIRIPIRRCSDGIVFIKLNLTSMTKLDSRIRCSTISENLIILDYSNKIQIDEHDIEEFNKWKDILDIDFITYLTKEISLLDPTINCKFKSDKSEWDNLPSLRSLFKVAKDCGLPIGNLTSQLFSNIFLNSLDLYCKRILKIKHYGRYVDDFYIVYSDKAYLLSLIPLVESFLVNILKLDVSKGKVLIKDYYKGIEFLGAFIKPFRIYIANLSLKRMKSKIHGILLINSINSYLGTLCHYNTYNIKLKLFFYDYN